MKIYIINGRVGKNTLESIIVETVRTDIDKRVLDVCLLYNMIVANIIFIFNYLKVKGKIYIAGDLNDSVGKKHNTLESIMGTYGETVRDNNGKRIQYCLLHIVANTFYQQKKMHNYTRRYERSSID